ncbi:hypothetical protein FIBSPDRAFT_846473 [Athelia psychrophila]|uniref:Transcription activator of gluconeogenesis ERT1 n=1 Tax=Athelia psychrophila TaxID=1759441 RepID=A0A166X2S1_9AGAM|nr:hypothetical protein FIBSPDRAFT_846473 [Fibularhizoctonia sp. CBS 109695]
MTSIHLSPYNSLGASSGPAPAQGESMNGMSSTCINPAQVTQNGYEHEHDDELDLSPMNGNGGGSPRKKGIAGSKRKRTESADDQRKNRDGPRKKKANRACFHCQKAHLTCDDTRPCQRCIKRGIADNCTEGHRKKAKYLLDEEELELLKRNKSSAPESSAEPTSAPSQAPESTPMPIHTTEPFPNDGFLNVPFDSNFTFGSEAANLEYSILSAILGNPSPPESGPSPSSPQLQYATNAAWPSDELSQGQYGESPILGHSNYASFDDTQALAAQPPDSLAGGPDNQMSPTTGYLTSYSSQFAQSPQEQSREISYGQYSQTQSPVIMQYPREMRTSNSGDVFLTGSTPSRSDSPTSASSTHLNYTDTAQMRSTQMQRINARVTRPYDYTEGYHFLMKHLPSRFEKNDILRIVRALAIFRPSLIAMQMPLTEEDEVFVEKCFQRSLLELHKLISFSGTPTVVWRRTGEICLVAPEFCMLTEWSMDELLGTRKYIYELFENQSVVEYYENFASHAFENTTQSVYSHCVLLKPSGAPIPATFCFSIRRDIYDLPSLVIGQWLPLL